MNEHESVPNIRFNGFDDDWKEKKFNTLVNRKSHITSNTSLNSIEYENISPDNHGICKNFNNKKGIYFQKGDILFGKLRPYLKKYVLTSYEGKAVGDFWVLSPKKGVYSKFAFYLIQTHKFYLVSNLSSGTKMPRSDWNLVNNSFFCVCNIEEQQKIGDLFTKLDKLLDLQKQKIEKLELLKKALLQKLFPKHDTKIPELRFKGYEEDWVDRKFVNCLAKIIDFRGKTPKKLGLSWSRNGNYRALSALNVKNGFIDKNIDVHFGNYDLYKKWMGKTELKKGDILFTTEAPMGNVAIIKDNEKYILSQRAIAFRVNEKNINSLFLLYRLNTVSVKNKLMSLSTGGTAQGISQKNLSYLFISISNSLDEQKRIGNILAKVDHLIYLENKKLENLQQFKKCLLQNMFVE